VEESLTAFRRRLAHNWAHLNRHVQPSPRLDSLSPWRLSEEQPREVVRNDRWCRCRSRGWQ
jgi:hypothetical protein